MIKNLNVNFEIAHADLFRNSQVMNNDLLKLEIYIMSLHT